jgi:hypothetical protein
MSFKPESPYADYPPRWSVWDTHAGVASWPFFGFSGKAGAGDVNRFGARYRLAKSFRGITVEGYKSDATIEGYNGLLRVFLVWSAVEPFKSIFGIATRNDLAEFVGKYDSVRCVEKIRSLDKDNRFYKFISERVDKPHQTQLANYLAQKPCSITFLASSIRHIFVHGPLTPNANDTPPNVVRRICDLLSDFHIHVMDQEFKQKMDDFEKIRLPAS